MLRRCVRCSTRCRACETSKPVAVQQHKPSMDLLMWIIINNILRFLLLLWRVQGLMWSSD